MTGQRHVVVAGADLVERIPHVGWRLQRGFAGRQAMYVAKFGADLADPERLSAHTANGGETSRR